jgi:hypothetical protein
VTLDGRTKDRFSTIEAAVEAVDYEIAQMGRAALASAREEAAWRRAPALEPTPPGTPPPNRRGEALRLAAWQRIMAPTSNRRA